MPKVNSVRLTVSLGMKRELDERVSAKSDVKCRHSAYEHEWETRAGCYGDKAFMEWSERIEGGMRKWNAESVLEIKMGERLDRKVLNWFGVESSWLRVYNAEVEDRRDRDRPWTK